MFRLDCLCRAFSPLQGFMNEATYHHVVEHMRLPVRVPIFVHMLAPEQNHLLLFTTCAQANIILYMYVHLAFLYAMPHSFSLSSMFDTEALPKISHLTDADLQDGLLWGLPVVLDTASDDIQPGDNVLLTYQGDNIATIAVDSKWLPDKPLEALKCYRTSSLEHPAVQMISMERGRYYIGGYRTEQHRPAASGLMYVGQPGLFILKSVQNTFQSMTYMTSSGSRLRGNDASDLML